MVAERELARESEMRAAHQSGEQRRMEQGLGK